MRAQSDPIHGRQLAAEARGAAAYRLLRGRVLQRARAKDWSCLGITSPGTGRGQDGHDRQSRTRHRTREAAHRLLARSRHAQPAVDGLSRRAPVRVAAQYFSDSLTVADVLFDTDVERLVIAGATEPVRNASELLATSRLDELLQAIRRRSAGALILIDLPPVTSTDEALVVAPRMDALFIVASEGRTRRDALARSMDLLSDHPVAGLILNRSSESIGADYYSY